jgi:hypothetical protein
MTVKGGGAPVGGKKRAHPYEGRRSAALRECEETRLSSPKQVLGGIVAIFADGFLCLLKGGEVVKCAIYMECVGITK